MHHRDTEDTESTEKSSGLKSGKKDFCVGSVSLG
jgi:hypothetical protein